MPQVSGVLLEITARDRPGRDGNTVYDIRVGASNAKFGTKITDWNGIAEEFEEGEQVTATFQERDAPNGGKYRNLDSLVRGSQPTQEPRSASQPARAIQPANDPRQLSIEVQGARSLAHELLRQEIAMDKIDRSDIDAVEQFMLVHTSLLMRVQNKVKESFSDHA